MRACGVTANSVDLGTQFGFVLARPDGVLSAPSRDHAVATVLGIDAQVFVAPVRGLTGGREISLQGAVVADTMANLATQLDGLKRWLQQPTLQVTTRFDTTRFFEARSAGVVCSHIARPLLVPVQQVTITLRCADPCARDATATTLAISTNTACALGGAISRPVITVTGVHSNLLLTLKNATGTTLETMGFTLALAGAGDTLVIDCDRHTVRKTVSSVASNAIDAITSGSFPTFLALDPNDGVQLTPSWPSLSASFASGTPTVSASYRKRWP